MVDLTWSVTGGQLLRRGASAGAETIVLDTDFDSFSVSDPMTIADFRTAMGTNSGGSSSTVTRTSIKAVAGRGNVINQHFLAGQIGGTSGIVFQPQFTTPMDEASIQYDIRFKDPSFDWGWGCKLPGLGGMLPGQGTPPAGGAPSAYGWSCRGMWITPGSYPGSSNSPNEWVGYIYDPTQAPGNYGQHHQTNVSFVADQWHTVKQYYKMNSVAVEGSSGNADGIHRMWLDGVLVYENTAQVYRFYENARITHLVWSMFYGGATVDWAPAIDTNIEIDNLLITTPA